MFIPYQCKSMSFRQTNGSLTKLFTSTRKNTIETQGKQKSSLYTCMLLLGSLYVLIMTGHCVYKTCPHYITYLRLYYLNDIE